ncbi:hypothetical protein Poli38472_014704 [Pythium oligandrum]|uniref:RING-type domain-containing protein n=1 Tax=Pythium oligandrum TaxID=41045 RepID=A0A8K1CI45_PYTOL|nr:hypothetical protein Poli38472_014704 [Pythium oligandrum]|eukprot:TMW63999.1 hypothetical protein Poli38472_014704 [Pythium oligandrum]
MHTTIMASRIPSVRTETRSTDSVGSAMGEQVLHLLEFVDLELLTSSGPVVEDVRYVLKVHQRRARAVWKYPRSFDEYVAFNGRMLEALQHGHFCDAGCPWLHGFLVSKFPAKTTLLLSASSHTVVDRRRRALEEVLQTLRKFLLNRINYSCPRIKYHVAEVFLDFVYGGVIDDHRLLEACRGPVSVPTPPTSSDSSRSLLSVLSRGSSMDEVIIPELKSSSSVECEEVCTLCMQLVTTQDVYAMRLRCGHRFHDECIVPKLNEELRCPTCGDGQRHP